MTAALAAPLPDREALADLPDPLGMAGIEYVEYTTAQPQALGQCLEALGFRPVARHRSREVLLYRQGGMNLVVNTEPGVVRGTPLAAEGHPRLSALALRVRDARAAHERALALGGWEVPGHAQVMELNIPGIHGPGGAHLYFIDRCDEFSIFDIDFRPIPGVDPHPPAVAPLHFFGLVQYIGPDRSADWVEFYEQLLGFQRQATWSGILPRGTLLRSPCSGGRHFFLQLVEPDPSRLGEDEAELFHRIGFGTPDVPMAVAALRSRGVVFAEGERLGANERGAITRTQLHTVVFEFVHDVRA